MRKNIVTGIVLVAIGIFFIVFSGRIHDPKLTNDVGPRVFPRFGGWGLTVCGIGILHNRKKASSSSKFLNSEEWRRLLILSGVLVAYALLLLLAGFLLASPILLYVSMVLMGQPKKAFLKNIVISVSITLFVYGLFERVLYVMLPRGIIFY